MQLNTLKLQIWEHQPMVLDGERLDPGVLWLTFEAALNDTHSWAEIAHRVASEGTQYMV